MNAICRNANIYPLTRSFVPDAQVSWSVKWPCYSPLYYTADNLKSASWADPEIEDKNFMPRWNAQDGDIDRTSHDFNEPTTYEIMNKYPLNPRGRTGLRGRGRLGRWGPNHAADAVLTRWKMPDKSKVSGVVSCEPILQFLAILRKDCRKWAIPGGFVNPAEKSLDASIRELFEEAINRNKLSKTKKVQLKEFFERGQQVYTGYVDDPRNTDNAWIETTAINFHDVAGEYTDELALEGRDDAEDVKWIDIVEKMDIYESHRDIIERVHEEITNKENVDY